MGYGITVMHEFRHTTAGGGAHDPPLGSTGTGQLSIGLIYIVENWIII